MAANLGFGANPYSGTGGYGDQGGFTNDPAQMQRAMPQYQASAGGMRPDQGNVYTTQAFGPDQMNQDAQSQFNQGSQSQTGSASAMPPLASGPQFNQLQSQIGQAGQMGQMGPNPYTNAQAGAITQNFQNLYNNTMKPQLDSSAQQAGGYGGSRAAIASGIAQQGMQQQLGSSLANLYSQNYSQDQNYNLGMTNAQNNYNLGMTNAGLTGQGQMLNYGLGMTNAGINQQNNMMNYGLGMTNARNNYSLGMANAGNTWQNNQNNFYTQQRGLDQSGMALGANLYNQGNSGYLGQGQGIYNLGLSQQQQPWAVQNAYTNNTSPYTGYGASNLGTANGSLAGSMVGGGLLGKYISKGMDGGSGNVNLGNVSGSDLSMFYGD